MACPLLWATIRSILQGKKTTINTRQTHQADCWGIGTQLLNDAISATHRQCKPQQCMLEVRRNISDVKRIHQHDTLVTSHTQQRGNTAVCLHKHVNLHTTSHSTTPLLHKAPLYGHLIPSYQPRWNPKIKDPNTPQMHCYATLWNICVSEISMLKNYVKQTAVQDSASCKSV